MAGLLYISTALISVAYGLQEQREIICTFSDALQISVNSRNGFYLVGGSIISTIVGAGLAYVIGLITQKRLSRAESAKTILNLLLEFETRCLEYWNTNYDEEKSPVEEVRIKAGYHQLRRYSESVDMNLTRENKDKLKQCLSLLYDAATGGDFESIKRKKSNGALQRIANLCSQISPILMEKSFK